MQRLPTEISPIQLTFRVGRRQTGLYSEWGLRTSVTRPKSGYNKGTIRSDIRYLVVSKDVRRHRLISSGYITTLAVTAEVASSSLVVPAIPNQALTPVEEFSCGHKKVQIPREASSSAHSSHITMFTFNLGLGG